MSRDLTNSQINRKSILNNNGAIKEIYEQIGFNGVLFEARYRFTKNQLAQFYEVDVRTIERLLENHDTELAESGYELFTGSRLRLLRQEFVAFAEKYDVSDMHVGDMGQVSENELLA